MMNVPQYNFITKMMLLGHTMPRVIDDWYLLTFSESQTIVLV